MHANNDHGRAIDALRFLDPGSDRETWVRIGMAAKAAGLDLDDFDAWSQGGSTYRKADVASVWRSIRPDGGVTEASLFAMARAAGWQDSERRNGTRHNGYHGPQIARPVPNPIHRDETSPRADKSVLDLWNNLEPATPAHGYIARKIGLHEGVRVYRGNLSIAGQACDDALVVPAYGMDGALVTVQFIPPDDGKKVFLPGIQLRDAAHFRIGGDIRPGLTFYVTEGISQTWSAHMATSKPSVVTFGAGRMAAVAEALHKRHPDAHPVLVADAGKEAMVEALARRLGCAWVRMPEGSPPNFDLNDMHKQQGMAAVRALLEHAVKPEPPPSLWPAQLDLAALAQREPEPPQFIMDDWLPCGYATLLAGHGGVGKSGVALYLAVCIASGRDFFGLPVERRHVLYLSCEDREGVLHWRLARICAHLGLDLASLRGWLEVLDLVGHPTVLWQKDSRTGAALTAAYGELDQRINETGAQVLFVDGISDAFDGSENARSEVKAFINSLLALIPADDGALLLLGHIAKPAAASGVTSEGYSGSTGWHNSVRARWYLYPETQQGDDAERPERTGSLLMELQKSNLGPTDRSMRFTWDEQAHLFVGQQVVGLSTFDRKQRDREEQDAILSALRASPEPVPAAMTGPRTAHHVLLTRPEFPQTLRAGKTSKKRFWKHIENLRAMGAITEDAIARKDRHLVRVLVATGAACGDAGNA